MIKKIKPKSQDYQVLPTLAGDAIASLSARRVLLCGESVFTAYGQNAQPQTRGFVSQPARETVAGFFSQFEKTTNKLNVWVDERILGIKKARFAFAVDAYLSWGLRRRKKGVLVLLGGASMPKRTYVEILAFVDGRLVSAWEKLLPGSGEPAFAETRDSLLADLRVKYPTGNFVQAAPLDDWGLDTVEYVGDEPLKGLSFKPIARLGKQSSALMLPAMIALAGVAAYLGFLMMGWGKYSAALNAYEAAIADPAIHAKGGIDTNFLNTMNARRIYMEAPRRQVFLIDKAERVMRGIASVDRVHIEELRLPAPSVNPQNVAGVAVSPTADMMQIDANRSPDVSVKLSVPKASMPALTQGKNEVLEGIARNTGMSVRIAQQGISEDKDHRTYDIEGFFHD